MKEKFISFRENCLITGKKCWSCYRSGINIFRKNIEIHGWYVSSTPTAIGITVTFEFKDLFCSLARF